MYLPGRPSLLTGISFKENPRSFLSGLFGVPGMVGGGVGSGVVGGGVGSGVEGGGLGSVIDGGGVGSVVVGGGVGSYIDGGPSVVSRLLVKSLMVSSGSVTSVEVVASVMPAIVVDNVLDMALMSDSERP